MPDLGTMKARIASELERSDLAAPIAAAIGDAIAEYERERFWFTESRDLTVTTVAGQRSYTAADAAWIATAITIDGLFATVGGQVRRLDQADPAELEARNDASAPQGQPMSWARLGTAIILHPVPDQAYAIRAVAHHRLAALAADSDSNGWTDEAEALVRRRAKQLLHQEVTLDGEAALALAPLVERALADLRAETSRRKASGRLVPTTF